VNQKASFSLIIIGALIFSFGLIKAPVQGEVDPNRDLAFPEGDIALGVISTKASHSLRVPIVNYLKEDVYIYGVKTSCGCIQLDLNPGYLKPGEVREIQLVLQPKDKIGEFKETVYLEASHPDISGLGVAITGERRVNLKIITEPDFGIFTSENGAEASFSIWVADSPGIDVASPIKFNEGQLVVPGQPTRGEIKATTVTPANVDGVDGYTVSGFANIVASSHRGPLNGAKFLIPLPERFGGGELTIRARGSFVPIINVVPSPVLDLSNWSGEFGRDARFLLSAEDPGSVADIRFHKRSGEMTGLKWTLDEMPAEDDSNIVGRLTFQLSPEEGSIGEAYIRIPFRFRGKDQTAWIQLITSN